MNAIVEGWCYNFGYPTSGFFTENGSEFRNFKLAEFVSKMGLKIEFIPAYSAAIQIRHLF